MDILGSNPTLLDHWLVVRRRWRIVAVTAVSILAAAIALTLVQSPLYRATATLVVEPDTPELASFTGVTQTSLTSQFYETQYEIIRSNTVLAKVFEKGELAKDPAFANLPNPIAAFRRRITVIPVVNSRLVRISVDHMKRERAIALADTLAQVYIEYNAEHRRSASRNAFEWLRSEIDRLQEKLESSDRELLEYKTQEDAVSIEKRTALLEEQITTLSHDYNEIVRKNAELETTLAEVARIRNRPEEAEALPKSLETGLVQQLKQELGQASTDLARLSKKFKPKHPEVVAVESQIASIRDRLIAEVAKIQRSLGIEYRLGKAKEESLKASLDGVKQETMKVAEQSIRYGVLSREVESSRKMYDVLLQRLSEAGVGGTVAGQNIRVLDKAEASSYAYKPRKSFNVILGLLCGILVGLAAAFLIDHFDTTLRGEKEISSLAPEPILGLIPSAKGDGWTGSSPPEDVRLAYRNLRAELGLYAREHVLRTLLITSSTRSEGKTVTSAALGSAFAASGARVLVVDTDLFRPNLARQFGLRPEIGLSDHLERDVPVANLIIPSPTPNLSILPAGRIPPRPAEYYGSTKLAALVEELKNQWDLVILDSPPIAGVLEVAFLAPRADGVLFVVRSGSTPRPLFTKTIQQLRSARANLVGFVLTDSSTALSEHYYGYYAEAQKARA